MEYLDKYEKVKNMYDDGSFNGMIDTLLPNVHLFWISEVVERAPLVCNPGIVLIGRGVKVGYLDDRTFRYDEDNYLVSSVTTAYECETYATEENPLIGLFIDLDISKLQHIIQKVEDVNGKFEFNSADVYHGVEPISMDRFMHKAASDLLDCLLSPLDSAVLGESIVDEILYRTLMSTHGNALVALTNQETRYAMIAKAINYIHDNYMEKIIIDDLAQKVNMSVSSFHRAFKAVTGESPIQYVKKTRLNKAKYLIVRENYKVNEAADFVGYESVSQFSREFKRHFMMSPKDARDFVSY